MTEGVEVDSALKLARLVRSQTGVIDRGEKCAMLQIEFRLVDDPVDFLFAVCADLNFLLLGPRQVLLQIFDIAIEHLAVEADPGADQKIERRRCFLIATKLQEKFPQLLE